MQVEFRDTGDLKRLNKQLRQHADGKQIRKQATRAMKGVLTPLVPRVQAAYRAGPSKGRRKGRSRRQLPDLRALLAKSVRVEVRFTGKLAGARIRADGRRMPPGMGSLPAYWEGTKPRWRHPLFGDPERWYGQPSHPMFHATVAPSAAAARLEIDQILQDVKRQLEAGS